MEESNKSESANDVELIWIFDAPIEKVWNAFTDPEILAQWYGPSRSSKQEVLEHDLRVGGKYLIRMETPGFGVHFNSGTFRKVVPHKELVYTDTHLSDYYLNAEGEIVPKGSPGSKENTPIEIEVSIIFEPFQDDGTKIYFTSKRHTSLHNDIAFVEVAKSFVRIMKVLGDPWL